MPERGLRRLALRRHDSETGEQHRGVELGDEVGERYRALVERRAHDRRAQRLLGRQHAVPADPVGVGARPRHPRPVVELHVSRLAPLGHAFERPELAAHVRRQRLAARKSIGERDGVLHVAQCVGQQHLRPHRPVGRDLPRQCEAREGARRQPIAGREVAGEEETQLCERLRRAEQVAHVRLALHPERIDPGEQLEVRLLVEAIQQREQLGPDRRILRERQRGGPAALVRCVRVEQREQRAEARERRQHAQLLALEADLPASAVVADLRLRVGSAAQQTVDLADGRDRAPVRRQAQPRVDARESLRRGHAERQVRCSCGRRRRSRAPRQPVGEVLRDSPQPAAEGRHHEPQSGRSPKHCVLDRESAAADG